jgi:uncharacterized protein (DUF849 family)
MNDTVIITGALTGGMTVPAQSKAIPITVDQIVEEGVKAGASVLHVHVRKEWTGPRRRPRPVRTRPARTAQAHRRRPATDHRRGPLTGPHGAAAVYGPQKASLATGGLADREAAFRTARDSC